MASTFPLLSLINKMRIGQESMAIVTPLPSLFEIDL